MQFCSAGICQFPLPLYFPLLLLILPLLYLLLPLLPTLLPPPPPPLCLLSLLFIHPNGHETFSSFSHSLQENISFCISATFHTNTHTHTHCHTHVLTYFNVACNALCCKIFAYFAAEFPGSLPTFDRRQMKMTFVNEGEHRPPNNDSQRSPRFPTRGRGRLSLWAIGQVGFFWASFLGAARCPCTLPLSRFA